MGRKKANELKASPLWHKIDFLAFFTVELMWPLYSHGITQGFSWCLVFGKEMQLVLHFPRAPQTSGNTKPIWAGRIALVAAGLARCSPLPSQLWDSKAATSGDADLGTCGFQVPCSRLGRTAGNLDTIQSSLAEQFQR